MSDIVPSERGINHETISTSIDPFAREVLRLAEEKSSSALQNDVVPNKVDFYLDEDERKLLQITARMGESCYYGRIGATQQELARALVMLKEAQQIAGEEDGIGNAQMISNSSINSAIGNIRRGLRQYRVGTEDLVMDFALSHPFVDLRNDLLTLRPVMRFWGELIWEYYRHKTYPSITKYPLDDQDLSAQGLRQPEIVECAEKVRELFHSIHKLDPPLSKEY